MTGRRLARLRVFWEQAMRGSSVARAPGGARQSQVRSLLPLVFLKGVAMNLMFQVERIGAALLALLIGLVAVGFMYFAGCALDVPGGI